MSRKIGTDYDFQAVNKATGLPAPTVASDAANKAYVDSRGGVGIGLALALRAGAFSG